MVVVQWWRAGGEGRDARASGGGEGAAKEARAVAARLVARVTAVWIGSEVGGYGIGGRAAAADDGEGARMMAQG